MNLISEIPPLQPPATNKVVVTRFIKDAGIGNQIFEFAGGLSIARKLGLPFRWIWEPTDYREFGLTHFGIECPPFRDLKPLCPSYGQGNASISARILREVDAHPYQECVIRSPFQCEDCFTNVADEVRRLFKLEPLPLDIPDGRTPVAVQVRRGDYVKHKNLNVTNETYFRNAMNVVRGMIERPQFFMVSDDPEWCSMTFGEDDITVMPPQSPIDGLRTMVACEAHIISNSTYGWWGAWLNESGPVVAPDRWYREGANYGEWNPVPERWLRASTTEENPKPVLPAKRKLEFVRELPPPNVKRAIVYPYKTDADKWFSLRYSLRSVLQNFEDKDCPIYIFGTYPPPWLIPSKRLVFHDCWTYSDALMRGVQAADKVLWMNDDICMLQPVTWEDCEKWHYLRPVEAGFIETLNTLGNTWHRGLLRAINDLRRFGIRDQKIFSTHIPYVYEREKAMQIFRDFGVWDKMPLEMLYGHLHADNPHPLGTVRTQEVPFNGSKFLNHTDTKLTLDLKKALVEMFPDYAPWEFKKKFDPMV